MRASSNCCATRRRKACSRAVTPTRRSTKAAKMNCAKAMLRARRGRTGKGCGGICRNWKNGTAGGANGMGETGRGDLAQALEHLAVIAQAPRLPAHDAQALARRRMSRKAGRPIGRRCGRSTSHGPEPIERRFRRPCAPSIFLGSMPAQLALQQLAADGEGAVCASRSNRRRRQNESLCCSSTGCAWIWPSSSRLLLRAEGATATVGCAWSGFPTMTATCKALASPAAGLLASASAAGLIPLLRGKAGAKAGVAESDRSGRLDYVGEPARR